MITRDQAEAAVNALMDQPKNELSAKQEKRKRAEHESGDQRTRNLPLIEAFVVAIAAYGSLDYFDYSGNTLIHVMLGAAIGGLFGFAIRRR